MALRMVYRYLLILEKYIKPLQETKTNTQTDRGDIRNRPPKGGKVVKRGKPPKGKIEQTFLLRVKNLPKLT